MIIDYFEYSEAQGCFHDNTGNYKEGTYGWKTLEKNNDDELETWFCPLVYAINERNQNLSFEQVRDLWTVFKWAYKDETFKEKVKELVNEYEEDPGYGRNLFILAYTKLMGIKNIFFKTYQQ